MSKTETKAEAESDILEAEIDRSEPPEIPGKTSKKDEPHNTWIRTGMGLVGGGFSKTGKDLSIVSYMGGNISFRYDKSADTLFINERKVKLADTDEPFRETHYHWPVLGTYTAAFLRNNPEFIFWEHINDEGGFAFYPVFPGTLYEDTEGNIYVPSLFYTPGEVMGAGVGCPPGWVKVVFPESERQRWGYKVVRLAKR